MEVMQIEGENHSQIKCTQAELVSVIVTIVNYNSHLDYWVHFN